MPVTSFDVLVERQLRGGLSDGSSVVLEQVGGVQTRADGTQVQLLADLDEPLQVGQTYLFFAAVKEGGALSAAPFARFRVQPDGALLPLSDWAELPAVAQLSGLDIEEAIHEIDAIAPE